MMGSRETKIGLVLIIALLIVLGVVLYNRLSAGPADSTTDEIAVSEEESNASGSTAVSVKKTTDAWSAKSPQAKSSTDPDGSSTGKLDRWGIDDKEEKAPDKTALVAAKSEPTFMPTEPAMAAPASPYAGYAGAGTPGGWQAGQADTAGSTTVGQPYDPYQAPALSDPSGSRQPLGTHAPDGQLNPMRQTDIRQHNDPANSPGYANPLRASGNTAGSTGDAQTGSQYPARDYNYPIPNEYPRNDATQTGPYGNPYPTYPPALDTSSHTSKYRDDSAPSTFSYSSHQYSPEARSDNGTYIVRPNDNYWIISKKLYGQGAYFRALAEHNLSKYPEEDQLQIGDEILAPDTYELQKAYPDLCPKPSERQSTAHQASLAGATRRIGANREYQVQEGDNLSNIALYELGSRARIAEIIELNQDRLGDNIDLIRPGITLYLPDDQPADAVTQRPGSSHPY